MPAGVTATKCAAIARGVGNSATNDGESTSPVRLLREADSSDAANESMPISSSDESELTSITITSRTVRWTRTSAVLVLDW